ncbi:metallophosphatase [Sphingobacterium sp. SRCM116780]|uniref:bifunctional metallophosphatase/5'-nucleotidase n=1 Tax=Sphingobacterium sp. SRCM116780 TaxID=2907623 RepID=UPI001F448E72|nr:metallophosphatase [Sphingobacterium sp. SRCM116780]UIR54510.1 metallophosphatase [Sphingobacterium sp. SRCM116780]
MEELKLLNRRNFLKTAGNLSAIAAFSTLPFASFADSKKVKLTILHTNDVHSRIEPFPLDGGRYQGLGGVARRSTLINTIRSEESHVLLLDAGDMFQGTPYFNMFGGKLELDLMTKLGYDAGTFGNHEFDNGLNGLVKYLDHAKFPFLTANYDFKGTVLEGKTQEFTIFKKAGVKIGVFGLGVDIEGLVDPNNFKGMKYLDPISVSNRVVKELKEKHKCDLIICLSHLGYQYESDKVSDLVLAAETSDIDLIIGGHTHTFLKEPTFITNLKGTKTAVNQVGFAGINLGRIDIIFEPSTGKKNILAASYEINNSLEDAQLV